MCYEYITYIRTRSILFHEVWAQGSSSFNSLRLAKLLSYYDPASTTSAEVSTTAEEDCLRDLLHLSARASLSSSACPMQLM